MTRWLGGGEDGGEVVTRWCGGGEDGDEVVTRCLFQMSS